MELTNLSPTPLEPFMPSAVGIIDLRTAPGADDPKAPLTLAARGAARRVAGYPPAPELSVLPMARLKAASFDGAQPDGSSGIGGSGNGGASSTSGASGTGGASGSRSSGAASDAAAHTPGGRQQGAFAAAPLLTDGSVLTPRVLMPSGQAASAAARQPVQRPGRRLQEAATEAEVAAAAADAADAVDVASVDAAGAAEASPAVRLSLRRRAPAARGAVPVPSPAPGPAAGGFTVPPPSGRFAGAADGAAALAGSEDRVVHVTGGVVHVHSLLPSGGLNATLVKARLQDLFAPVGSSNCRDGVGDAAAAFDPAARRFYVAASCGGRGSTLLAVSATPEPFGPWYLYNLNADAVGTRLACPGGEAAVVDYPRLTFNADALAISLHSYCPAAGGAPGTPGAGAALLVLPKGALASGETRVAYPVFTSFEVSEAAERGALPESIQQLEPAAPQGATDVGRGALFFVAEVRGQRGDLAQGPAA
jgi:hypothetical protein